MKREQIIADVLSQIRTFSVVVRHTHERSGRRDRLEVLFQRQSQRESWTRYVVIWIVGEGDGPFQYTVRFETHDRILGKELHSLHNCEYRSETDYKKLCEVIVQYLKQGEKAKGLPVSQV